MTVGGKPPGNPKSKAAESSLGRKWKTFTLAWTKLLGESNTSKLPRGLRAFGGACGVISPQAAAGRAAARTEDWMTSLEDSTLHVTLVTHWILRAKWQPGHIG